MTPADLEHFERCGYSVLRGVVSEKEADRFLREAVRPALLAQGIDLENSSSWPTESGGVRVRGVDGHPIGGRDKRWPELFDSNLLREALDVLHGGRRWRWFAGAVEGVGWIHLRFPTERPDWTPPKDGWHLDGTLTSVISESSVILLPVVTALRGGGGGTALLSGSHREIGAALAAAGGSAVDWERLHAYLEGYLKPAILRRDPDAIVEAMGEPGDVLVLHPYLYHAASDATKDSGVRVTFNLALKHTDDLPNPIERCFTSSNPSEAPIAYGEPFFVKFEGGVLGFSQDSEMCIVGGQVDFLPTTREDVEACAVVFVGRDKSIGDAVQCGDCVFVRKYFPSSSYEYEEEFCVVGVPGRPVLRGHHDLRLCCCTSDSAESSVQYLTVDPTNVEKSARVYYSSSSECEEWQRVTFLNFLHPSASFASGKVANS